MNPNRPSLRRLALRAGLGFALVLLAVAPLAAAVEKPVDRSFAAAGIERIELENLAGRILLVGDAGSEIRVRGTIHAEDSAGESARALADSLAVEFDQSAGVLRVTARYPLDRHTTYHYPKTGDRDGDWGFGWFDDSSTTTQYLGRRVRVTGSSGRSAATLWADFEIEIPAGVAVVAKNRVGGIDSSRVDGDQTLDTASGSIRSADGRGRLVADTGSGDVLVDRHQGDVGADTGSGDVTLRQVTAAELTADTGSGDLELVDCTGSLDADTGSGNVTVRALVAGATFRADTGSGDVRVDDSDFSAVTKLVVDTGSGDVRLALTAMPSVRLSVSTGSGDIELDVEGARVRRASRDSLVAELGTAEGSGDIDTGSGDVVLRSVG